MFILWYPPKRIKTAYDKQQKKMKLKTINIGIKQKAKIMPV